MQTLQQNRTEQNRTEQNRTEQNRTEQNRTEQNRTEQNRTEQNRTEQNRTEQNRTSRDCDRVVARKPFFPFLITIMLGLLVAVLVACPTPEDPKGTGGGDDDTPTPSTLNLDPITFNGKTYIPIQSPDTGKVWLDRNLGATQVCTAFDDTDCYGDLYQWGRNDDGHESRTSVTTTTQATSISPAHANFILIGSETVWDWVDATTSAENRKSAWADNGVNDICPPGYSVPTKAELQADTVNATTKKIINTSTAFESFLKLPAAGIRGAGDGIILAADTKGNYWTRNYKTTTTHARRESSSLGIVENTVIFNSLNPSAGMSVRCIKG